MIPALQNHQLFAACLDAYSAAGGALHNAAMYPAVAKRLDVPMAALEAKVPVGKSAQKHSLGKRSLRWMQQNMRRAGMLERLSARGEWQLTDKAKAALTKAESGVTLVAFSTDLGLALWTEGNEALWALDEPIHALITSPPYPIRGKGRAYGIIDESRYIDFICGALEPIIARLAPGGSLALNVGQDCYVQGLPTRSLYRERLVIALADRFGLHKCDDLIWHNPSKAPAPVQWASKSRVQLQHGYEPILWMTNDPKRLFSNNQRVLQPHSEKHLALIARGGEHQPRSNSDGAYQVRKGSYANPTAGKIPRNVLRFSHTCADQKAYKAAARKLGLPVHGAPMPVALARFLTEFLTEPGQLVVDRFGGSLTTAKACELTGRRWIAMENALEYVRGGAERFLSAPGFRFG